jgi:hypothetical protein
MTTSTSAFKHYYVCNEENFTEFCAAALMGFVAALATRSKGIHREDLRAAVSLSADAAEMMLEEFTLRRSGYQ